jgi:hypothetical protein
MKKRQPHPSSYLAALVIGAILFAVVWKAFFESASSAVVISGIAGVVMAVILFFVVVHRKSTNGDQ